MEIDSGPSIWYDDQGLRGYINGGGNHGIEIAETPDRRPATRWMCMNLEHFTSSSHQDGIFVPRKRATTHTESTESGGLEIRIEPFHEWNIETTITLERRENWIFEASYSFSFHTEIRDFLPFFSNYFIEPTEPFIRIGGQWYQPELSETEHHFWARSAEHAEVTRRVYHRADEESEIAAVAAAKPVDAAFYDFPLMVTPIGDGDYHVINVIEPGHCSSLSANRRWKAHDFALFGADFSSGDQISAKAWLAVRELKDLDDALRVFDELVGT